MVKKQTGAAFERLKSDLKNKTIGSFYVLYGEETYLRQHYFSLLSKSLIDELTQGFNFHHLTAENISVRALSESIEALPMMAQRSLIQVDDVDFFAFSEEDRGKLVEIFSDLPEYCCLVLTYEALEFKPDKRKKKLWDAMEKHALLVEFCYQSESDLQAWIMRHVRANGKYISRELCSYLLQQTGMSMTRLDNEIEKICAFCAASEIVRADIDAVVEPTLEAVVFQISDALAQREFARALERLHTMLQLRAEPIAILAAIGSQMRRLNAAKVLLGEGKSAQELAQLCGIAPFAARKTISQAGMLSQKLCERAVVLCRDTDLRLKTSADEPQRLLELLILALAEEARHD